MSLKKILLTITVCLTILLPLRSIAGGGPERAKYFPDIPGFKKSENIIIYTPETLFEFINGAAEIYFTYDFIEVFIAVYEDDRERSITAEIYDQGSLNNSFGIYSQERPYECEYLKIGSQANYMEGYLNFYQDRYYVKISGYNLGEKDREYLVSAAQEISGRLGGKTSVPPLLKALPEEERVKNSESYISRDFLGYSFFRNVFVSEYERSGIGYKMFIIEERDRASAEKTLSEYMKATDASLDILKDGIHEIDDPYQGKIYISGKGRYIAGLMNPDNANVKPDILNAILSNLK